MKGIMKSPMALKPKPPYSPMDIRYPRHPLEAGDTGEGEEQVSDAAFGLPDYPVSYEKEGETCD